MANYFKDPMIDELIGKIQTLEPKRTKTDLVILALGAYHDQLKNRRKPSQRAVKFQREFIVLKKQSGQS